jgi:hypothetical protein
MKSVNDSKLAALQRLVMQQFATGSLLERVLYPYLSRSSRPLRRTMFL